jgi:transcriptional regulator GlxA family with amidase domain
MVRRIEVLGFPACQLLDVAGPLQVFASANDMCRAQGLPAPYDPVVVAAAPRLLTSSGLALEAESLPGDDVALDTLVIAGGWGVYEACEDASLLHWIASRAARARRATSVCSGALLLATTGLLDGRRAVTHWWRCADFAARFPKVRLEPDPIFIEDGKYWTSAGVTAGIDLALAMVEADLGRDLAMAVARQLVVFLKRPGGQSQFSAALTLQDQAGRFDALHGWIMENLQRPLALPELALQSGMSERNFSRRYREETGRTPARAVEDMRIETARRLLEQHLPVTRVARRCGYGSEETLRRAFLRRVGVSPQTYRERFAT